ncbi:alfin [Dolichospermum flos-aquae]|uniref:Alfin n=1 Tax=Dolichospermum flos-aquae LEGE 04289 TaxID=1828708 RepID=A0ACC5PXH6_DOLFA|nr:alfin [Dolichospermum flos-aquae]MBE9217908.1 alfin [Dolichospermum flos-aquae LEGE 04289]
MINSSNLPRSLEEVLKLPNVHFIDRTLLPNESGIYFVIFEAQKQRLAYVGKAENLRMRWAGHHREPELWLLTCLGIPVDIAWIEVEKEYLRTAEKFLIEVFRPPLNDIHTLETKRRSLVRNNVRANIKTVPEVLQDYRDRKYQAVNLLQSDEFWEICNSDDGDLICPWIYPDGFILFSINDLCDYRDTHNIMPSRVPYPPSFSANSGSGTIAPKEGYIATNTEKRYWLGEVAQQIDAWLVAVAYYYAAQISVSAVHQMLQALSSEETVEQLFINSYHYI